MKQVIVYVVSDSVGETADLVTRAALGQFTCELEVRRVPFIEDTETLRDVIQLAKSNEAIIAYTLVLPKMREFMAEEAAREGVAVFDIIGPLVDKVQHQYNLTPLHEPGIVRRLDDDYFKKVEAIEFAVKYDDGRDPKGILKADIVLVGISRTSKTPLSQYLAHKRYKVANIPLVPEVDPPEELYRVPKEKCFGLMCRPEKLNGIRKERLKALGLSDGAIYASMDRIEAELHHFYKVVDRIGCDIIDVSHKAVEETANLIIAKMQANQNK